MEWLKRLFRRFLGLFRSDVLVDDVVGEHFKSYHEADVGQRLRRQYQEERAKRPVSSRGIQSTDLGIRKLSRHRSGRLYDKRSGFDPRKRMDEDDERPPRKKKTWFEDRKHD